MPVVTSFKPDIKLPYQCPLHPIRDVHGKAELAKLNYRVNLWTCAKCGKSFTGESDLETHIHLRHPELSEAGDFSVCLADYCDILRCDPQRDRVLRRPWPVRQPDSPVSSAQVSISSWLNNLPRAKASEKNNFVHNCLKFVSLAQIYLERQESFI